MTPKNGQRIKGESLTRQVARAEQQIIARRLRISQRARALHQRVREKLSSPVSLLVAGGLGFVAERLLGSRGARGSRGASGPAPSAPAQVSYRKLFTRATRLFLLARSLMMAYRAATANQAEGSGAAG